MGPSAAESQPLNGKPNSVRIMERGDSRSQSETPTSSRMVTPPSSPRGAEAAALTITETDDDTIPETDI